MPHTLRNPLYHWTHLELKRYFGIDELLDERSAPRIWEQANAQLAGDGLRAHGILRRFHVKALCTTDDPTDDLACHKAIAASGLATKVFPAFRPDKALNVHLPEVFNAWVDAAGGGQRTSPSPGCRISLDALGQRHDFFHSDGRAAFRPRAESRLRRFPARSSEAAAIFAARPRRAGGHPGRTRPLRLPYDAALRTSGRGARAGPSSFTWARGAATTPAASAQLGPDTGFDSIGDWPQVDALGDYLDRLDRENALPKMVIYNLNPADNYAVATMIGNFQDGGIAGKIQFGSGWWFLDQKEAMSGS